MPIGTLLLRERASTALTTIVEKSQHRKPPLPKYDLVLNSCQLDLILKSKPDLFIKPTPTDEGFESDIDSVSLISSDDCFTPSTPSKTPETDSANGSASSDSDTETAAQKTEVIEDFSESYHLVDCVCYTDVKFPNLLVFVIKGEALVFHFDDLKTLQGFYVNFSALKAVTNQKTYSNLIGTKFNLLHRTDNNGVTHIEITREPEARLYVKKDEPTRIISLKTPEANYSPQIKGQQTNANLRQRNESLLLKDKFQTLDSTKGYGRVNRSASIENLIDCKTNLVQQQKDKQNLRKVWGSAEDLLNIPKPPERRRKPKKGRAPPPPINQTSNEKPLKVPIRETKLPSFNSFTILANKPSFTNILNNTKSKLTTYQQFKYSEPKKIPETSTLSRNKKVFNENSWTNSVPRLLKPRSRSETRNFTPMAYRYIDTTKNNNYYPNMGYNTHTISNRLFGMSSKLKDFNEGTKMDGRWGSMGDLNYKNRVNDSSLKSVIKKEDHKRKGNEKKVTFSAYTTVQVV